MRFICALLLALPGYPLASSAGTASFLPGGKQVARINDEGIMVLDLNEGTEKPLALPEGSKVEHPALASTGPFLLTIVDNQVTGWNPAAGEWKTFCAAPEGTTLSDLAADPKTGDLLLAAREKNQPDADWWLLKKGAEKAVRIENRRADEPDYPVFDADGVLYFCCEGDVWKGGFDPVDDDRIFLTGGRIWPLAEKETGSGNSAGVSAQGILPLREFLIVGRSRTGGSGWGSIVRLLNEDAYGKHLALKWDEMQESGEGSAMALSPDGRRAAIYLRGADSKGKWFSVDVESGKLTAAEPLSGAKKKK